MSIISARNIAKSYGPNDIFTDISLSIPRHARIGLVGPNGVGKTTLLRILYGEEVPSEGIVERSRRYNDWVFTPGRHPDIRRYLVGGMPGSFHGAHQPAE